MQILENTINWIFFFFIFFGKWREIETVGDRPGNPMDRGAWRASPWGPKVSDTTEHSVYRLIPNSYFVSPSPQLLF